MRLALETYLARAPSSDVADLIAAVARSAVKISHLVRAGGAHLGSVVGDNVQGEAQKALDVAANEILMLGCADYVCAMASEEMEDIVPLRWISPENDLLLLFDPLDGSSNIDVNVSIGTIFSVLRAPDAERQRPAAIEDFLQPGEAQLAAGYVVYGPQTTLVLSWGQAVHRFVLDPTDLNWWSDDQPLVMPKATAEFSINASNQRHWDAPVQHYVEECLAGADGPRGKNFNMRWVASMVADMHRILTRGGVFLYPWDRRDPKKPGKLRLLYEANPMALLVEAAGGAAFDGRQRILAITPKSLHERVAVMLGSREEIERLRELHTSRAPFA